MAEIFLAREYDSDAENVFVVKRLLPHIAQHPDLVQMFIDEVRVAATLDHDNVVSVYNVGAIGDQYFQSMEYLRGVDVRRICQLYWSNKKAIPRSVVSHVLISVATGLDYVHSREDSQGRPLKLIHRDISPHNVFLTAEGAVKILDFGVAKAANALHQTRTGALVGKLSYMSPEQAKTHDLDHRSDIFSLGIVMWELLAGRRLFRVKDLGEFEVLRRLCEEEIPPPSELTKGPRDFDRIVARAVAKDRDKRYQSAAELADDLKEAAERLNIDATQQATRRILQRVFAREFETEAINREKLVKGAPVEAPQGSDDETSVATDPALAAASPVEEPFPDAEKTMRRDRDKDRESGASSSAARRRTARRAAVRVPVVGRNVPLDNSLQAPRPQKRNDGERRILLLVLTLVVAIAALLVATLVD